MASTVTDYVKKLQRISSICIWKERIQRDASAKKARIIPQLGKPLKAARTERQTNNNGRSITRIIFFAKKLYFIGFSIA